MLVFAFVASVCICQIDQFNCDYLPEPLPAWVDSLDLKTNPQFINERKLGQPWNDPRPHIRIGDLTLSIPQDSSLKIGFMKAIGTQPAGVRNVQEDEYITYDLKTNGFRRYLALFKGTNHPAYYTIKVESPKAEPTQFKAWQQKLTNALGLPTLVSRTELPKTLRKYEREVEAYSAIEDPATDGQNYISLMWVWGVGKPSRFTWEDVKHDESGQMIEGPTTTVILTYAEESTAVDRKTKKRAKQPRALRLIVNPTGIMAG